MIHDGLGDRFWRHVKGIRRTGCLIWQGQRKKGYGIFERHGHRLLAHRVAWEAVAGPIPEGMVINHLCRNRACVRTTHLEVTTDWGNLHAEDSLAVAKHNGEKTNCLRGHPFDEENTYWYVQHGRSIGRHCRQCRRERNHLRRSGRGLN
jgi:HNH endonuclease